MGGLARDVRQAVRSFARRPLFTAVAIALLAVGIGANVAIVAVVRAVLLSDPGFRNADRVVALALPGGPGGSSRLFSVEQYATVEAEWSGYESVAGCSSSVVSARGDSTPEEVNLAQTVGDFFAVFAAVPVVGRQPESTAGRDVDAAVISFGLWQSQFGGRADVVGRIVRLDGDPWMVVGVMPREFAPPCAGRLANTVWVSRSAGASHWSGDGQVQVRYVSVFARLRESLDLAAARASLTAVRLADQPQISSFLDWRAGRARSLLVLLQIAAAIILAVSCGNLANLLLARMSDRYQEVGLRSALGASRLRLVRQFLSESAVLGALGGLSAVGLAAIASPLLTRLAGPVLPQSAGVSVLTPELIAGVGLGLLSALLFGTVPALGFASCGIKGLQGAAVVISGRAIGIFRGLLVAAEVAIAMVLIVCAGLLTRSFVNVVAQPLGFDAADLVAADIRPLRPLNSESERRLFDTRVREAVKDRVGGLPVAFSTEMPFSYFGAVTTEWRLQTGEAQPKRTFVSHLRRVSPEYFAVLRIPLIRGRLFTDEFDRVAVVNEKFVSKRGAGEDLLGSELLRQGDSEPYTIVGIVGDIRITRLTFDPVDAVYVSLGQSGTSFLSAVVRTPDPAAAVAALRRAASDVDPDLALANSYSVAAEASRREDDRRVYLVLVLALSLVAVGAAAFGTAGVVAYVVRSRRKEFGLRLALGAPARQIVLLAVRQTIGALSVGLVGGATASWWLMRLLAANADFMSQVYRTNVHDLGTFGLAAAALTGIGITAAWIPARSAARVDPVRTLRAE